MALKEIANKQIMFSGDAPHSKLRLAGAVGVCFAILFSVAGPVRAQSEEHPVTVSAGGGLTTITGHDAGKLDHGGHFQVGAAISSTATLASLEISCSINWESRVTS